VLQQLLNLPHPDKLELNWGGGILRVGDRVIQLKHDYDREVFNGDLRLVVAIDMILGTRGFANEKEVRNDREGQRSTRLPERGEELILPGRI